MRDRGRVEGVGLQDVRARLQVGRVDGADDAGLGQGEEVVVPLEITGPVGKPLAPVVPLTQPVALDHRPHRPIQHQDPPRKQRLQLGEPGLPGAAAHGGADGGQQWSPELQNKKPEAKTPQGERFSSLFNVAAISANRHGISC